MTNAQITNADLAAWTVNLPLVLRVVGRGKKVHVGTAMSRGNVRCNTRTFNAHTISQAFVADLCERCFELLPQAAQSAISEMTQGDN